MSEADGLIGMTPDVETNVSDTFGIDTDKTVTGFAEATGYVPEFDPAYRFDPQTTMAILAGFEHNRRVMVQGYHGTGKSTHIEDQSRQPCQPDRSGRQGCDCPQGWQAGYRVPGRPLALGAAAPGRAGL